MFMRTESGYVALLQPVEAEVLHTIVSEVIGVLSARPNRADPLVRRLFPDLYRNDAATSLELRKYTEDELRATKLDQAKLLLETLPQRGGEVMLDESQAEAWLRALTDVRIALGLRLGLTDETDLDVELDQAMLEDPISPRVGHLSVYTYLTYLQESLVGALIG